MQGTTRIVWMVSATMVVGLMWGCATEGADRQGTDEYSDVRQEIEEEFGELTDDHVEGFERELQAQYRQLKLTYHDYDEARQTAREAAAGHDEHRLHLKLERRHTTIARYHEDRMWLHISKEEGDPDEDRRLARLHREAADWHGERFEDDGVGISPQDERLESIRTGFENVQAIFE